MCTSKFDPITIEILRKTVVDPRFPMGGHGPLMWELSAKMFVKMKESCSGGVCPACPLDPPMENIRKIFLVVKVTTISHN